MPPGGGLQTVVRLLLLAVTSCHLPPQHPGSLSCQNVTPDLAASAATVYSCCASSCASCHAAAAAAAAAYHLYTAEAPTHPALCASSAQLKYL
jgi:hypothetical protein